jgi:LacI family transcriptional regulator
MTRRRRTAQEPGQPVTLKVLAQHLGLSPATISLVINRSPAARSIPAKTKDRVLAAAQALNYRPNQLARSLRSKRSFSVGVLLPEISEGYAASILAGIDALLVQEGYFFLVASHRNKPDLLDEYFQMLTDRLVEGYIVVNTPLAKAPARPAVAVSGHRRLAGVTNVAIDHDRAAFLALSHLAELGHERIAFFKGHRGSSDRDDRWRGIEGAARSLGLRVRPELTLELEGESVGGGFSPEEGYKEGYVFGQKLLARAAPFTSLFAFNDVSAIGAMRAFCDAGLRVPGDVSVVGFDDIQSAAFQNPRLTTVRQPLREMGETAARMLLRRLAGEPASSEDITVEPQLIVRESTGPAPHTSGRRSGTRRRAPEAASH